MPQRDEQDFEGWRQQIMQEAKQNLTEALELFFEVADLLEIQKRLHTEIFVTRLEVAIG